MFERQTRRRFLRGASQAGIAAAGLLTVGAGGHVLHAGASQGARPRESIQVLIDDLFQDSGILATASALSGASWRTSTVLETRFAFTHVGLHWRGSALSGVELRTGEDGERWTAWQPVTVEGSPEDNPRREWFGSLVGARRHRLVQYRIPASEPLPDRLTVTYLNSIDGPRRPLTQLLVDDPRAKGPDLRGEIVTREEWGADESLRFDASGEESWTRAYVAPRMVAVHHTATRNFSDDPMADVRAIYAFHTITRGWGDMGYNALIDAEGRIYEGRRGRDVDPFGLFSRDILAFGVVGAHASGYNYGSASVSLLGNFMEIEPSDVAWKALEDLLVFLHRRYEIDPREVVDFARSNDTWRYGLAAMCGHRDCNTMTECPGDYVYARLPALRARVAERITGTAQPRRVIDLAPGPHNVWLGTATYRWQGPPPHDRTFEGFWRHPNADPVDYLVGYDGMAMPERTVTSINQARFLLSEPGQYTLHVRPAHQAFADRVTVIADRHIVCDNADADGIHRSGVWVPSQSVVDYYGADFEIALSGSDASFSWELRAPESGRYRVQVCWASAPKATRAAAYTVLRDDERLAELRMDQSVGGGSWTTLDLLDLEAGQRCVVELHASGEADGNMVIADAARIILDA